MSVDLAVPAPSPMAAAVPGLSVEALIAKALEHGISVEGLEKLLAMRERLRAEAAREAFFTALSAFQAECPVIPKLKTATGSYSYRYAPLDDIVERVAPLLGKHGLSHTAQARFEDLPDPAQVVIVTVHHVSGHSESSEFRAPIDGGARMNVIQKHASSLTYAKRYAFCNALGILTGDEDVDGAGAGPATSDAPASSSRPVPGASRPAGRTGSNGGAVSEAQKTEIRALNERLGERKWSPAVLMGRLGRPDGYVASKAELEAQLGKPPAGVCPPADDEPDEQEPMQ